MLKKKIDKMCKLANKKYNNFNVPFCQQINHVHFLFVPNDMFSNI